MNGYAFKISNEHEHLVKQAINILSRLNVPISANCTFEYYSSYRSLGQCMKEGSDNYLIKISDKFLNNDDCIINTAIHELLHTIPNNTKDSHRGIWKKWADYVSRNSNYIIAKNNEYDTWPNCSIKGMNNIEKNKYLNERIKEHNLEIKEIFDFWPYLDNNQEIMLMDYIVKNVAITHQVEHQFFNHFRKHIDVLANKYCSGCYDDYIEPNEIINFEGLFSLTKYFNDVTLHSKQIFGKDYLGRIVESYV